jgi:hypothetical protein
MPPPPPVVSYTGPVGAIGPSPAAGGTDGEKKPVEPEKKDLDRP